MGYYGRLVRGWWKIWNIVPGDVFFDNQEEGRRQVCEWAKANRNIWEAWLPDETSCFPGFGMVNAQDEPATWQIENNMMRLGGGVYI